MPLNSAMSSGVSGRMAEGQALGVVGDNVANSSTIGFNQSRALFEVKVRPGTVARHRDTLLCLPPSLRATDAERFAAAFAPAGPTGLVLTRLDETRSPVGRVHASVSCQLPVSVLCFGQRVPEDVAPATTGAILDYLLARGAAKLRLAS